MSTFKTSIYFLILFIFISDIHAGGIRFRRRAPAPPPPQPAAQPFSITITGPLNMTVGVAETYTLTIAGSYVPNLNIRWESYAVKNPKITSIFTFTPSSHVIAQLGVQNITVSAVTSKTGVFTIKATAWETAKPKQKTIYELKNIVVKRAATTTQPPTTTTPPTTSTRAFPLGKISNLFNFPSDVAFDTIGNMYVVDRDNHRVQKFDPRGTPLFQ